jgi:hypothetical protein
VIGANVAPFIPFVSGGEIGWCMSSAHGEPQGSSIFA